jgi:hypothetical protein
MSTPTEEISPAIYEAAECETGSGVDVLFGVTTFLSAFLLFQVQLIVSKYILPWFGGSAAVWTTSMLVFQVLLLGGYLYSHAMVTRLSAQMQARVHVALLSLAVLVMGILSICWPTAITPGPAWRPASSFHPALKVSFIILVSAGLPFFVLSTTGPLVQAWFGRLRQSTKAYRLYALSNIGSLLGLISFPFVMEPLIRLRTQATIWTVLFCVFAFGCAICAWRAGRVAANATTIERAASDTSEPEVGLLRKLLWFALPACASALLLATTNLLCQEVITIPLLWVLPLAIYLLSFILCFDHPRWYQRAIFHPWFAASLFVVCAAMVYEHIPARLISLPMLLFAGCMVAHGELVKLKPGVSRLTAFYLSVSAGGACGGVFVAVVAPSVFKTFLEFEISVGLIVALLLITLVLDKHSWIYRGDWWLPVTVIGGSLLLALGTAQWIPGVSKMLDRFRFYPVLLLVGVIVGLGAFVLRQSPTHARGFRFAQVPVVLLTMAAFAGLYSTSQPKAGLVMSMRNFYGVVEVMKFPGIKQLMHGRTLHGSQLDPPRDRVPITYYGARSGVGILLQNHPKRSLGLGNMSIGVVGLGTGTIAAYGKLGDSIRYYDIDPDVVQLSAGDHPVFTFLKNSKAAVTTVLGDARLSLEEEAESGKPNRFDVLVLDAFSGDAVPTHLLTKEAFLAYTKHLDPQNGIIAVHITSRHVNLVPVLLAAATEMKASAIITHGAGRYPDIDALWFIMSPNTDVTTVPGLSEISLQYVGAVGPRLWTDDYSDIFRLLY